MDRGQTGLLLAALLTPIKTGRHFIALAYQISWHSGINKGSNKYDLLTSPRPPREQKSLLLINLGPSPSPTPALFPSPCHTPEFLESVSCFVSFSDKFLLGFCLLLSRFLFFFFSYFFICFFLLLFYATLCFAINFAGQLLRLRAAARIPHNARHYCLRFLHSVSPFSSFPSPYHPATCHVNLWRFC